MAKDVKIAIVGDATKYKAALTEASTASDKFSGKTKQNGDDMAKFGLGALTVGAAIGVGLFQAGQSASNLGESVNAVTVTFGESAAGILKLGENAAKAVGLSNVAFNGLAVQFSSFATTIAGKGGNVVGTMEEMTGRAADFASVMNIEVAEAARLFQSGLAGETEPLKKFGIDLSAAAVNSFAAANGIGTLGEELSESEKITARYQLLMEQTSKTQGDFANTSDSAANAARIAKAEMENAAAALGSVVAPVMAKVAKTAASLATGFVDLNEATGGAVVTFGAFAGGGLIVLGVVVSVTEKLKKMHAAMVTAEGGLSNLGKVSVGAGAALGVVALAVYAHGQAIKNTKERQDEFIASMSELAEVADDVFGKTFGQTMAKAFLQVGLDGKKLETVFDEIAQASLEGAERALEWEKANGKNQVTIDGLTAAIDKEKAAVKDATTRHTEFEASTDDLERSLSGVSAGGAAQFYDAVQAAAAAEKKATDEADRLTNHLAFLEGQWDSLTGAINDHKSWLGMQTQFDELKVKATEAFTAAKKGAEDAEQKGRDYEIAVDDQKLAVIEFAKEVLGLPESKVTEFIADIDQGKLDEVERKLEILARARAIEFMFETRTRSGNGGTVPLAEGGIVKARPGGTAIRAGEAGVDEAIVPLDGNHGIGGGPSIYVTVQGSVTSERDLVRAIYDGIIDGQRRGELPVPVV